MRSSLALNKQSQSRIQFNFFSSFLAIKDFMAYMTIYQHIEVCVNISVKH